MILLKSIFLVVLIVGLVTGHGRMEDPAARNCAWRFGFSVPANYNDNELNCGGSGQQHAKNEGRCGVCGDSFNAPIRQHEVGGQYATGTIVKTYQTSQTIDIKIFLTANHKGYMEFRICPVNNPKIEATQECLDKYLLHIINHGTRYLVKLGEREIYLKLKLPDGLTCTQCVLQWKYRAGNTWGSENGVSGLGVGPQEEFYNCADVNITQSNLETTSVESIKSTTTTSEQESQQIPLIIDLEKYKYLPEEIFEKIFLLKKFQPKLTSTRKTTTIKTSTTTVKKELIDESEYVMSVDGNSTNGKLVCAIRGIEKSSLILLKKVKKCMDLCSISEDECPYECICAWME